MGTDRAFLRGFRPVVHIPAVPAVPFGRRILLEDLSSLDILQQGEVSGFMLLFHFGDLSKGLGSLPEPFLTGDFGKILIQGGPFKFFSGGRSL